MSRRKGKIGQQTKLNKNLSRCLLSGECNYEFCDSHTNTHPPLLSALGLSFCQGKDRAEGSWDPVNLQMQLIVRVNLLSCSLHSPARTSQQVKVPLELSPCHHGVGSRPR